MGWQPSRFLADRAEAERAFALAEQLGNVNAAQAALRNWVINLNKELAGSGVYAGHVVINVLIGGGGPEGSPTATPEQIAPLYWDLHETRDRPEAVFSA